MPRLPNEILDLIWSERCKLGFEPRILQPKWIDVADMRVPAFYVAQPQASMTQLCRGAREVAAKGFYSRVFDNPSTGDGGFWWNEDDVLYIDHEFYRELHPPRKAFVLGRDKITRVALDTQIDENSTPIVELIVEWFPNLSQVFLAGSARFYSHWFVRPGDIVDYSLPDPNESAITKSFPITAFQKLSLEYPNYRIRGDLFIRLQGLTSLLNQLIPAEERTHFLDVMGDVDQAFKFFIFDRVDTRSALNSNGSSSEHGNMDMEKMTLKAVQTDIAHECAEHLQCLIEYITPGDADDDENSYDWSHDERSDSSNDERPNDWSDDARFDDWSDEKTSHDASDDMSPYDRNFPPPFWRQQPQ